MKNLFDYLGKSWLIFGPKEIKAGGGERQISIELLSDFDKLVWDERLPFYSFKRFFVPEAEGLFKYRNEKLLDEPAQSDKIAFFGMNVLDLRSTLLYDQVFREDVCYQQRRSNFLVIGHNIMPNLGPAVKPQVFDENMLEHLSFDIFFLALKNSIGREGARDYAVFAGSPKGQKVLDNFGYKDYIKVEFKGLVKEGLIIERMQMLKDKLENHHSPKIWEELGKRCIECGKCTIACPTCFCFRIDDEPALKEGEGERERCWDSCYYQEFSEVSGGHKFLDNTAGRIHFWYFHKFARIPKEYNMLGCVGCRRCAAVCPVGIDIKEVLRNIEQS
ncbi:MAG: 4Fe-4S dicluster domain-containing protein [Candidatus Portnoybacteria bacterium]|nr:4Fe-4S dicluster domain-containing protein [Candidatus Portnoybacteria bacterium]